MNATKRKFNALLQGLNSPRPTSNEPDSTSPTRSRLSLKRARVPSGNMENPLLPTNPVLFGQSLLKKRAAHVALGKTTQAAAKYCPSDREQLLRRLATFQEITDWTPKPDKVNEVAWAKRGWVCQGKERVRCVLCHKELVVKLNRKEQDGKEIKVLVASEIEEALVDKYAQLITSEHQFECLWRKRGCEDSLLRVSFANATMTLEALRQRYDDLCSRHTFLPYEFNLRLPDDLNLDEIISHLPTAFFTHPPAVEIPGHPAEHGPNRTAFALALMGWQGLTNPRIGPVPNTASCSTCLRRLGLWMFKSKEVDADGKVLVAAPMDHLDPVREHRFFCPWKNADAQARSSDKEDQKPAWQQLVQMIKNEHDLRDFYESRARKTNTGTVAERSRPATPGMPQVTDFSEMSELPQLGEGLTRSQSGAGLDDDATRDAKDKERWARLRRVKSLFDTKGATKRLRRPVSVLSTRPRNNDASSPA